MDITFQPDTPRSIGSGCDSLSFMKKVFYGVAIRGVVDKKDRSRIHQLIIEAIKNIGCYVIGEHTVGSQED